MSQSKAHPTPEGTVRQPTSGTDVQPRTTHETVDTTPDRPNTVELFDVLGSEWRYLPYDPDTVCKAVLPEETPALEASDLESVCERLNRETGITVPDPVIEHAASQLEQQYDPSDVTVLLQVMQSHGELIKSGAVDPADRMPVIVYDYPHDASATFRSMRTLHVRTERAATHLGRFVKNAMTQSKAVAKTVLPSR